MKQILLVEDDPFLIEIYSAKFKKEGFNLEIVAEGDKVLKKLIEKKPDLMLLDIVLPTVDGWEILKMIKNDDRFKNLKIVILSNLSEKEDIEKGLKFGATEYLIKSHYTPGEVVEKIKEILR